MITCMLLASLATAAEPTDEAMAGADAVVEPTDADVPGEAAVDEEGDAAPEESDEGEGDAPEEPAAPAEPEEPYPLLWPGQCTSEASHFDLEELYHHKKFDQGLAQCESRLSADADDVDLLWMKARFLYELGETFGPDAPDADKEAHYETMLDTAERGLELDPGNLHLRFARGIAMGRLGTTRGVLASLFMANDVEADWLAVANSKWQYSSIGGEEVLPCDAFYALGIFYRLVPDWWIVKVLAGTKGDLTKSISFHEKATACKPHEVKNSKELGASQLCKGTKDKDDTLIAAGKATLTQGLTKKARYERDQVDLKHIQMLIDDPSLACEYSRDGQQDLDKKKLED